VLGGFGTFITAHERCVSAWIFAGRCIVILALVASLESIQQP
jgi:hypothetical protein